MDLASYIHYIMLSARALFIQIDVPSIRELYLCLPSDTILSMTFSSQIYQLICKTMLSEHFRFEMLILETLKKYAKTRNVSGRSTYAPPGRTASNNLRWMMQPIK